jgi:subtilisin family serine protease
VVVIRRVVALSAVTKLVISRFYSKFKLGIYESFLKVIKFIVVFATIAPVESFSQQSSLSQVISGEYVIEMPDTPPRGSGRSALETTKVDRFDSLPLGGSSLLLSKTEKVGKIANSRRRAALTSRKKSKLVPYDPNDTFCAELIAKGLAKTCSPNFVVHASSTITPNDEFFDKLWGLNTLQGIGAPEGWEVKRTSEEIVVAVVDTGVDYSHPDLMQNMWTNLGEIPANGIDDDANGYIDDVYGVNTSSYSGDPFDDNFHGTHVAGTIAGIGNNSIGITGVAWNAKIMALKFLDKNGSGSISSAIAALNYLLDMKQRGVPVMVANNSWGGTNYSAPLESVIQKLAEAGIVFVAAAGNDSADNDAVTAFPANAKSANVISVGAIDREQNLASFSNYGATSVHIAAPGVGILSTSPRGEYRVLSGTSMAAPYVSGAAALLLAQNPQLSPTQVKQDLIESGADRAGLAGMSLSGRTLHLARLLKGERAPVVPAKNLPNCIYEVRNLEVITDSSLIEENPILSADELSYTEVKLPFSFPFYGSLVDKVTISPNGVLYLGTPPATMDFRPGVSAPKNSIAVLHSDLYSRPHSKSGVRVKFTDDSVTFLWRVFHYTNRVSGEVKAWLTLNRSGAIDIKLQFENRSVEREVRNGALVGISGLAADSSVTFAKSNELIADGLSIRFSPLCGGEPAAISPPVSVTEMAVIVARSGGKHSSRALSRIVPGSKLKIELKGSGTGVVPIAISLGEYACPQIFQPQLKFGVALIQGRIPPEIRNVSSIIFSSGSVKERVKLRAKARTRDNFRRKYQQETDRLCESFVASFSQLY